MTDRAIAPVLGVVLLVVLAAALAGTVAVYLLVGDGTDPPPTAAISATVDVESDEFRFVHEGGDVIDVDDLTIVITVDGEPLTHQPPVPFVGGAGFWGSPSGAFNDAGSTEWSPGERATFTMACTNEPKVTRGSIVHIELVVGETHLATLEVVAR